MSDHPADHATPPAHQTVQIYFKDGTWHCVAMSGDARRRLAHDFAAFVNTPPTVAPTRACTYDACDDEGAAILLTVDFSLIKFLA